ncbi:AMP-binding protein [Variovorax robiniae]|uniref:AMP-binding protein n=1 Tax=Variovorax robiniae TaxID=1836199 RepID=A0ABU8XGJ7_9BURK
MVAPPRHPSQAGLVPYESLIADNAPLPDRSSEGNAMAAIIYTGGTTGFPKGVMLSHDNLVLATVTFAMECPYEQDTIFLHVAPMFHLAALSSMFSYTSAGATHVVAPSFDPAHLQHDRVGEGQHDADGEDDDRLHRPLLQAVPTDVSSLRKMIYGAAPISEALLRRVMKSLPNVQLFQGYGQTEMSGGVVVLRPEFHAVEGPNARLLRAAGRASMAAEIRIVDDEMNEVPRGTVGEIVARGATVMLGYWNKPEQTRSAIVDGWLRSGDAGYMDEEGFVFIVDRLKDMIVSGGENVFSAEVENALARHPAVLECAVIGIPHAQWGESVHAELRLRDGFEVDEEALGIHCAELIAGYKRPRSFNFRTEPLPLSAAGKIIKNELRKPYWDGQARSIA